MSARDDRLAPAWRPALLLGLLAFGLAWLGSWFAPPTRAGWDALDMAVFRVLDASLAGNRAWQVAWALMNTRAFDLVAASYFVVIFLACTWRAPAGARVERIGAGLFVAVATTSMLGISTLLFDFERLSPTWVVEGAQRLSELVPEIEHKDWSGKSFPGDHGVVVFMFTGFIGWIFGRRAGALALAGALFFVLPRLVSGAHWLSDVAAGSVALACCAMGVSLGTPVLGWTVRGVRVTHDFAARGMRRLRA